MKRGGYLKRRAPVNPRNAKRRAARYARNFGERADAVRVMPCVAAASGECEGPVQACHARARGMGGCNGDRRCLFPGCARHHAEAGEHRTSQRAAFEERHGVDLLATAEAIANDLDQRGYE